ncbi:MAG: N-6 DNA methylase, partial [Candidatus Thorarchaeota archaeon]
MPEITFTELTFRTNFHQGLIEQLGDGVLIVHEPQAKIKRIIRPDYLFFRKNNVEVEGESLRYSSPEAIIAGVDTKKSTEDISEDKHLEQVTKYMSKLKLELFFLTNYHELRVFSTRTGRLDDSGAIDYEEMGGVLSAIGRIIRDSAPDVRKISVERIVSTLNDAINHLMSITKAIPTKTLQEHLGLEMLVTTSNIPKEDEDWKVDLARGAAYLVIAQILFYMILYKSRERTGINYNPKLKPLGTTGGVPSNLQSCFDDVTQDIDYQAVFGNPLTDEKKVLLLLDDVNTPPILRKVIGEFEGVSAELAIQNDLLGHIFQRLLPFELRKRLAAFYTKPTAARFLSMLAIDTAESKVFDPACGSGTILAAAYNQKRDLGRSSHRNLLDEVYGNDLSPFATSLACVNLAIQNPTGWSNEILIVNENAFDLRPDTLEVHFDSHRRFQASTSNDFKTLDISTDDLLFDVIFGNPPFTRGERLP